MIVLYDDNGISIDGPTSISDFVDQVKRFKSAGWAAELIDGQDQAAIAAAITRAQKSNKPSLIACKTTIGYGAPHKAGTAKAHGEALGADELKGAKEKLGISLEPFSVPDDVLKAWREAGSRGAAARKEWEARFAEMGPRKRAEFERRLRHERPASLAKALRDHKKKLLESAAQCRHPQILGSRDRRRSPKRCRSNSSRARPTSPAPTTTRRSRRSRSAPRRRRAASSITASASTAWRRALNGIFLHGGFAPNGATFLVFTDYARPAMRLAALMGTGVDLRHDPRLRSASAKTARPTSRSSISQRCAPSRTCACSGPATPSRSPSAGSWRSTAPRDRPCWR